MNIKNRLNLFLFLRLFLLKLLAVWHTTCQIRQIYHADIGHIAKIHIAYITQISEIAKITVAHGVKGLLHTIVADAQIWLDMYHLACHALRPAADIADILVVV